MLLGFRLKGSSHWGCNVNESLCRSMRLFIDYIHCPLFLSWSLNNLSIDVHRNGSSVTPDHSSIGWYPTPLHKLCASYVRITNANESIFICFWKNQKRKPLAANLVSCGSRSVAVLIFLGHLTKVWNFACVKAFVRPSAIISPVGTYVNSILLASTSSRI